MKFTNELNDKQVVVLVPFEELKAELINVVRQEIKGIQPEQQIEDPHKKFYSPTEVRDLFHVSRSTLHNWKHQGLLVPRKIGGKVLYERFAVERVVGKKAGK
ncbi:MAG: helix-turn-helix domain-containing protein [Bacteroidetes bacterium]|nr:helix-turn-helix domain-containing protein [Bacteroidota bacterium]